MAFELHESSIWLPAAATTLLACMENPSLRRAVATRPLLDVLGQLAQQVSVMRKSSPIMHAPAACHLLSEHASNYLQLWCMGLVRASVVDH